MECGLLTESEGDLPSLDSEDEERGGDPVARISKETKRSSQCSDTPYSHGGEPPDPEDSDEDLPDLMEESDEEEEQEMVKPPVSELGGPRADRKLKNSEGEALQAMVPHKFTLEACADDAGKNRVFIEIPFCSPAQSFLERDVSGEHVYCNPPFQDPVPFLAHINQCYEEAPTRTSALVILPSWNRGDYCKDQLQGWQLLRTYPRRSKIFEQEVDGKYQPMGGTPWPVQVWYKAPMPERHFFGDTGHPTFICKGSVANTPAAVGLLHEKVEVEQKVMIGSLKKVLLDTGATDSFVNPKWLLRAGYSMGVLKPANHVVKLANGQEEPVKGLIRLPLKIGQYKGTVKLFVLDIGDYDVILGDQWLRENKAYIDYANKSCTVRRGSKRWVIRPYTYTYTYTYT